jgi:hypothetical protein
MDKSLPGHPAYNCELARLPATQLRLKKTIYHKIERENLPKPSLYELFLASNDKKVDWERVWCSAHTGGLGYLRTPHLYSAVSVCGLQAYLFTKNLVGCCGETKEVGGCRISRSKQHHRLGFTAIS